MEIDFALINEVAGFNEDYTDDYRSIINEAAKQLGFTEHTIRFYTDKGLVPNVTRDRNNNRLFDEESINWLTGVKYLKECGMSIEAIKDYVDLCLEGNSTIEQRYQIVLRQKTVAEEQLRSAQERIEYLNAKIAFYQDIMEHNKPDFMNPGTW